MEVALPAEQKAKFAEQEAGDWLCNSYRNEMGRALAPKSMIVGVSHDLGGDSGIVYHDLYFGWKVSIEMENVGMSAKNTLAIQRCELSRKEFDEFLSFYPIPLEYRVILPTSTHTILDAPPGYIDTIVPSKFPQLLLKENMLEVKSFKDKIPSGIEQNPQDVFRSFIYTEEDEDLTFLPKDLSPGFNTGSPSVSINTEPVKTDEEPAIKPATEPATVPVNERVRTTSDSGGVPKDILFLFTLRVLQPELGRGSEKQKEDDTPMLSIFDDDEGLKDCLELKDTTACHLKIPAITPLTRVVDNAVNRRSRELLKVIEKLRGEADVMRARELAREEECEGLRAKLMLESQKWSSYQEVKHDKREVVSKIVPYACMELLHSDELGRLIGKLVSFGYYLRRCRAMNGFQGLKGPSICRTDGFAFVDAAVEGPLLYQDSVPLRNQLPMPASS
ncbi:hypothetical protein Tco_0027238 [Tanacetum coccineum]